MNFTEKAQVMNAPGKSLEERLYLILLQTDLKKHGYNECEKEEGMSVVEEVIGGWWKQRYLIDRNRCRAYEIMNGCEYFTNFTDEDIDWESIDKLPEEIKMRAKRMSAHFPTFIHKFNDGIAEVSWQLNPEGRYFMDEEGYGMTCDDEITVYGFIDRAMNMLVKFRYIDNNWDCLKEMRDEAEKVLKKKNIYQR